MTIPTKLGKTSKHIKNIDLVTLLSKWSFSVCSLENAGKVTFVTVSGEALQLFEQKKVSQYQLDL